MKWPELDVGLNFAWRLSKCMFKYLNIRSHPPYSYMILLPYSPFHILLFPFIFFYYVKTYNPKRCKDLIAISWSYSKLCGLAIFQSSYSVFHKGLKFFVSPLLFGTTLMQAKMKQMLLKFSNFSVSKFVTNCRWIPIDQ